MFLLFVLEMSATFASYFFQVVPDLDPVTTAFCLISFDPVVLNIFHQTMAYATSVLKFFIHSHLLLTFLQIEWLNGLMLPSPSDAKRSSCM
jgi:hypothetical protein